MLLFFRRLALLGALTSAMTAWGSSADPAQLTAADYVRAERLLYWSKDKYLIGGEVTPHWIGQQDRFWYRRSTGPGSAEFVVIDAASGARTPAFDHARVALGLAKATGKSVAAEALPFKSFRYAEQGDSIEFMLNDRVWSCQIERAECTATSPPPSFDRSVVVSPNGKWAAFLKDHNLWIRALDSGAEFALTTDGVEFFGYAEPSGNSLQSVAAQRATTKPAPVVAWSPDSRKILTHRVDEREVQQLHLLQSVPVDGAVRAKVYNYRYSLANDTQKASVRQLIFDVGTRQRIELGFPAQAAVFMTPIEIHDAWWSEDSREVFYVERGPYYRSLAFKVANATTGKAQTLFEESGETFVELASLGHRPMIERLANGSLLFFSERDGWGHLYLRDTRGRIHQITRGEWLVRGIVRVDERAGTIYFTASGREPGRNPYFRHLYRVRMDGSGLKLLTPEDAEHQVTSVADDSPGSTSDPFAAEQETYGLAPSGNYFVDVHSRPDRPPTSLLRAADGRLIATLETADVTALEKDGYLAPQPFEVLAADGKTRLYGTLFRPSGFDAGKKYPVVDSIYPGPQITRVAANYSDSVFDWMGASALAELGFVVVTVDGRGTPLRSKEFLAQSYGKLGQAGNLDDHIAAIRQLAQRYSWMDLERVGIFGQSGGGFASARAILQRPDFYKVAVAAAGNHDQRGYVAVWGETYNGPDDGKNYLESANAPLAANLRGKLLLIHGDMDENVHPALTLQLVDALIKANKDFDLLIVPNAGHGVMSSGYAIRRQWDYFVRHLLGAAPPLDYRIAPPAPAGE